MSRPAIDLEAEKKEILRRYRGLLRHKDMRRRSGEPYIYHPISAARVMTREFQG